MPLGPAHPQSPIPNPQCQMPNAQILNHWTVLAEFTGHGETAVTLTDPDGPAQSPRFYRLR
jgi:hypothetical protein